MNFKDNTFDTVVDTFGLEYYLNPAKALQEMKRVCKENGLLLILASGMPESKLLAKYNTWRQPIMLGRYGRFSVREWDDIIRQSDFDIIQKKRFLRGTIYYYILRNTKQGETEVKSDN
jgi:methyltransferase OMS1